MKAETISLPHYTPENKLVSIVATDQPIKPLLDAQKTLAQIGMATFGATTPLRDIVRELADMRRALEDSMKEIRALKEAFAELEKEGRKKKHLNPADYVYKRFKAKLEKDYFGKIVAIDDELGRVVGIGDTVSSAYDQAKEATGKEQFDFKRVGYSYIDQI